MSESKPPGHGEPRHQAGSATRDSPGIIPACDLVRDRGEDEQQQQRNQIHDQGGPDQDRFSQADYDSLTDPQVKVSPRHAYLAEPVTQKTSEETAPASSSLRTALTGLLSLATYPSESPGNPGHGAGFGDHRAAVGGTCLARTD